MLCRTSHKIAHLVNEITHSHASLSRVTDLKKMSQSSEVQRRDIHCSSTGFYLIEDFMGEGLLGKDAKGVNLLTSQIVALKILKILQTEQTAERGSLPIWDI